MEELRKFIAEQVINHAAATHPNMSWVSELDVSQLQTLRKLTDKAIEAKTIKPKQETRRTGV